MLSHEQQAQALGCDDTSCIAALRVDVGCPAACGAQPGAGRWSFILNLKVIAVEEAETVAQLLTDSTVKQVLCRRWKLLAQDSPP